jgi:hypothetical protein
MPCQVSSSPDFRQIWQDARRPQVRLRFVADSARFASPVRGFPVLRDLSSEQNDQLTATVQGEERMTKFRTVFTSVIVLSACAFFDASASAEQPGVIAFGEERAQLQATPIVARPYRPLHFYGNTVRRRHQRAVSAPRPSVSSWGFRRRR